MMYTQFQVADIMALSQVESLGAVLGSRLANGNRTDPYSFIGKNISTCNSQ